ncbi:Coxsackievirus and adenovirus receptor-like [Acipenser ruthenus]|uniref:Coxsackievirus and adenovirus receptor-like n=1 Tax=Acipenser ruthenus TaxID=7906 RepID=A0A444V5X0_ACIRT|nr:Coxsackievirus and adenovirus receptor-like [Acipenser ruthenus]
MDRVQGSIVIKNATSDNSGTYRCVSENRVGKEQCTLSLSVVPPSNTAGTIAGAVIGSLLVLLLLAIILYCCYKNRNKKKYEKETAHEISKICTVIPFANPIITYSGDRVYEDYYATMKGRVHFNSPDPKAGDASINITKLLVSDTGTYLCKVKKAPGVNSRKTLLTVMVKPSVPKCYVEGSSEQGKDILMKCKSAEGTNPIQYTWERISGTRILPATALLGRIRQKKLTLDYKDAGGE